MESIKKLKWRLIATLYLLDDSTPTFGECWNISGKLHAKHSASHDAFEAVVIYRAERDSGFI